jgi:hypothetical protein
MLVASCIAASAACDSPPKCGPVAPGELAQATVASCVAATIDVDACVSPEVRRVTDCLLDFGQLEGAQERSIIVTNPSSLRITFETELVVDDSDVATIELTAGDASGTLEPGVATEMKFLATPQNNGEQSALFTIRSNASNAPDGDVVIDVVAAVE